MRLKFHSDTNLSLFADEADVMGYDFAVDEASWTVTAEDDDELADMARSYGGEVEDDE